MPLYTPPAGNAVDFELVEYTVPLGSAVDFDLSEEDTPDPGGGGDAGGVGGSVNTRLERIYASLAGHVAPSGARDTYFLMRRIGQVQGLDLTSGRRSFEGHLAALYADVSGSPWTGAKSAEFILRAIESEV